MSRGHAARGGLDGCHVPLLKDWGIKEAVPAPLGPMHLLVAGSPAEVPLILGCFWSPAHHAILAACYAASLLVSGIVPSDPVLDQQRRQGSGTNDRYVMLPPRLLAVVGDNRQHIWPALECRCELPRRIAATA